jgi:hypothetical protein
VEDNNLPLTRHKKPITLYNIDETPNKMGSITHKAQLELEIKGHIEIIEADVADIGNEQLILGIMWLKKHNPEIDWEKKTLDFTRCPDTCSS